jgi:hypothetical protein
MKEWNVGRTTFTPGLSKMALFYLDWTGLLFCLRLRPVSDRALCIFLYLCFVNKHIRRARIAAEFYVYVSNTVL